MKFKVKELIGQRDTFSMVYMECVTPVIHEVVESLKHTDEVDITVVINGHETDPKWFFNQIGERYDHYLRTQATSLMREQLTGKFYDMISKLTELEEQLNDICGRVDWDTKLTKEKQ